MTDLALVVFTMGIVLYAAYFIYTNDRDGNARPDKTLMAMAEDKLPETRRWGRLGPSAPPHTPPPPPGPRNR